MTAASIEAMRESLNFSLKGQHGIALAEGRPTYLGTFVEMTFDGNNFLVRFTKELVFYSTALHMFNVVEEKPPNASGYPGKLICDDLFVGDKKFGEWAQEIKEKLDT